MFDWKDKVCIITGACSGIGYAFLQSLVQRGAKCLMADLNFKVGEEKAKEHEGQVIYFRVDVTSAQNFEAAFEKCLEHFGRIDVLINSAGINGETNWESQLQINLLGSIRGCKLALKYMGQNGYGCSSSTNAGGVVMNISSIQGLQMWPAMPTYSAGKSGLITYTRSAGHPLEFAQHGVKMVCLCPGAVETPIEEYKHHVGMTQVGKDYLRELWPQLQPALQANEVSEAGMKIIESANSGSVWFIHSSGQEAFEIPDQLDSLDKLLSFQAK